MRNIPLAPLLLVCACVDSASDVNREGTVLVEVADNFETGQSDERIVLVADDGDRYELVFDDEPIGDVADDPLAARGLTLGERVVVAGTPDGTRIHVQGIDHPLINETQQAVTVGSVTIAIIMVNFLDLKHVTTKADIDNWAFRSSDSMRALYLQQSWNKLSISGVVLGPVTISASSTSCNPNDWANRVNAQVPTSYDYVMYVLPEGHACNWGGLADIGGRRSWVNAYDGKNTRRLMIHEVGHNLGLGHANGLDCGQAISALFGCTPLEYHDPFNPMGGLGGTWSLGSVHFSSLQKWALGWLPSGDMVSITSWTSPTTRYAWARGYVLGSTKLFRLSTPQTCDHYIDFRGPQGLDATMPVSAFRGVAVYRWCGNRSAKTHLLDLHPESPALASEDDDFADALFFDGQQATIRVPANWPYSDKTFAIRQVAHSDYVARFELFKP